MVSDKNYTNAQRVAIRLLYGDDNLFSDTEPEELLMVERKQVLSEMCRAVNLQNDKEEDWIRAGEEIEFTLTQLFGDKCVPDKESSVKGEPRFKVGDKVRLNFEQYKDGEYDTIDTIIKSDYGIYLYHLKNDDESYAERYLEPYTEPETKDNIEKNRCEKCGTNAQQCTDSPCQNYPLEAKELNLCELLKGCIGEWFYVTPCGEMELKEINKLELKPLHFSRDAINCLTKTDGRAYENGSCIIYPSRTLYEKYPLDAKKAWMEWQEARKPKRWRAKCYDRYWIVGNAGFSENIQDVYCHNGVDQLRYEFGNYFRTKEEAEQAAEAVRGCLEKFHKEHSEK